MPKSHVTRIALPLAAHPHVPRRAWWEALIGAGGVSHQRLLSNSGCSSITLKSDSQEPDLRVADDLYVLIVAPSKEALQEGVNRVQHVVQSVCGDEPAAPAPPPPPSAPQVIVPPSAEPQAPPPAWGRPASATAPRTTPAAPDGANSCEICYSGAVANVRYVPCGHGSCSRCVADLRKRAIFITAAGVPCPFCRTVITRYDAPPGVDVGEQPAPPPEATLALRVTLPPLEVRRAPQASASRAPRVDPAEAERTSHPRNKTALCVHYLASRRCEWGSRCNFAHGVEELRKPEQGQRAAPSIVALDSNRAEASRWRSASPAGSASSADSRRAEFADAARRSPVPTTPPAPAPTAAPPVARDAAKAAAAPPPLAAVLPSQPAAPVLSARPPAAPTPPPMPDAPLPAEPPPAILPPLVPPPNVPEAVEEQYDIFAALPPWLRDLPATAAHVSPDPPAPPFLGTPWERAMLLDET